MELLKNYIYSQVASKALSKEDAKKLLKEIYEDKNKIKESSKKVGIIGIGCRISSCTGKDEYWNALKNGVSCIREFPQGRRKDTDIFLENKIDTEAKLYKKGGYLEEIDQFDASFFKISPKEAELMDPTQRIFLEVAWEAIEDAGMGRNNIKGTRTGVYVGKDTSDVFKYQNLIIEDNPLTLTGGTTSILASRIAYMLNLKGPSIVIDTACSSSAVALHTAMQAIINNEIDMAIVGGVGLNFLPIGKGVIDSPDETLRIFDKNSNGTVWGEGIGVVILKPLDAAVKDKNNICATILGSAINNDGASNGLTAPNPEAQCDVITRAWEAAGINPETISYIEAHGTGTKLGDLIELKGISKAFRKYTDKNQFCAVGSVKTNIGHLVGASGIASVIKMALSLKNKGLLPSINFNEPSINMNLVKSPIYINDTFTNWNGKEYLRRCGINSFGLSGTNCHLVLEEPPVIESVKNNTSKYIFTLSAKSIESLQNLLLKYKYFLDMNKDYDIGDICYTVNTGRGQYNHRIAIIANDLEELKNGIDTISENDLSTESFLDTGMYFGTHYIVSNEREKGTYDLYEEEKIQLGKVAKLVIENINAQNVDDSELEKICELYIQGADVEWDKFYRQTQHRIVSLPTCQYDHRRYWIDNIKVKEIDKCTNTYLENLEELSFRNIVKLKGRNGNEYTVVEKWIAQLWNEVLGFGEFDINDNYFELGGDSLKATMIISKIYKEFSVEISLGDLFKFPTIKQISEYIGEAEQSKYCNIEKAEEREYYPLSPTQLTFFMINENDEKGANGSVPLVIRAKGEVNNERMENAFKALIERHEAFRTSIEIVDEQPMFKLHKSVDFKIDYKEISEADLSKYINEYIRYFDLRKAPLMRVSLIKTDDKKFVLLIVIHHIVIDGYSINILQRDLLDLYHGKTLPEKKYDFRDFLVHNMEILNADKMKKREEYWLQQFFDGVPLLNVPSDISNLESKEYVGDSIKVEISSEYARKMTGLASKENATLHMVIYSIYTILMSKYSGQNDIVIGSISAGRDLAECKNIIGAFINVIPVRTRINQEEPFLSFLNKIKNTILESYENQYFSFDEIKKKKVINNDLPTGSLFSTLINFHTEIEKIVNIEKNNLFFEPYGEFNYNEANLDIELDVLINDSGALQCVFEYNSKKFKRQTMEKMTNHFVNIMDQILIEPNIQLSKIDMLSEIEKQQLLIDFNATETKYDYSKTFVDLFETQVELTPNKVAVVCNNEAITYKKLNDKVNQLARNLKNNGAGPNVLVGIMVERSINMIVGVLGILKSGSAYVPIDTEYPEDRIQFILEDSGINLIITQKQFKEKFIFQGKIIDIDDEKINKEDRENLLELIENEDLAYVIYTSGTTGKPKGVLVKHINLTNAALSWKDCYELDKFEVKLLQLASISFDVFVGDLGRALINGGQMVICPADVKNNFQLLHSLIQENDISILESTPSLLSAFMDFAYDNNLKMQSLKILIMGSDICPIKDYKKILQRYGESTRILNSYGVTEATIDSSYYEEKYESISNIQNTPIGKPMPNVRYYILDKNRNLQPIGIPGELYIGGVSVTKGYLNRKELTEEKFVPDIINNNSTMYKTGDLVKWLDDGNVEFLGRIDNQVKIRGYRIELGEVENSLLEEPMIAKAVVVDKEDSNGEKNLCAYVVSNEIINVDCIKESIRKRIPQYMVPQYIIQLDKMPVTLNGKIDIKALPSPEFNKIEEHYVAPRNELEEKLCNVLKSLLKLDQVGISDNFFNLGGNSLKAIIFLSRIHKELNVKISINDLFENPYIKNISEKIMELDENKYLAIKAIEEREYYPSSSEQKRLYALNQLDPQSISYNIPTSMILEGNIEFEKVEDSFRALIKRHEILRTTFAIVDDTIVQKVHDNIDFSVEYKEINEDNVDLDFLQKEFIKPFSLNNGSLIRAEMIKVGEEKYILFVDVHHIIADGKSIEVLMSEFVDFYEGKELPPLKINYKDYSVWENEFTSTANFKEQERYWTSMYKHQIPELNMPLDLPRPNIQSFAGDRIRFELGEDLTKRLTNIAKETNTTTFMTLFAAYGALLANYTCVEDMVIGVPIDGRNHDDIENAIGMFVNTLAIRIHPEGKKTFKEYLYESKETLARSYANQDFQFEELLDKLNVKVKQGRNPLFDVVFNFRTHSDNKILLNGINVEFSQIESKVSKFDFALNAFEIKDNIYFELEYCTDLFFRETMEKLKDYFIKIIEVITENIDIYLNEIELESFENDTFEMEELEFNF